MPVKNFQKTEVERRRLYLDYDCWLEDDEQLVSFQTTIYPYTEADPLSLSVAFPDEAQRKIVLFADGGVGNTNYIIEMVVQTDAGQTKRDDIGLRVLP